MATMKAAASAYRVALRLRIRRVQRVEVMQSVYIHIHARYIFMCMGVYAA